MSAPPNGAFWLMSFIICQFRLSRCLDKSAIYEEYVVQFKRTVILGGDFVATWGRLFFGVVYRSALIRAGENQ